jgi:hypothetical protein
MESRIPALAALVMFAPDGTGPDPVIAETQRRMGGSRWYPVPGGHRVLIRYDGSAYDTDRFTVDPRAWDHEHCDACNKNIPAMTLCWVTRSGQYFLLCINCHDRYVVSRKHKRAWWQFW